MSHLRAVPDGPTGPRESTMPPRSGSASSVRVEAARVIAVAEEAGALRAIVSGSGPTIAALVEDPGSAQRVSRALKASGLVAEVLRADAPVAGARVVG